MSDCTSARLRTSGSGPRGFVAVELVTSIALLFVPALVLVALVPVWSERRHAATVVAREVARTAAADWPSSGSGGDVDALVDSLAADYHVPRGDLSVAVSVDDWRGGDAVARVSVLMPLLHLPLIGDAGGWHWSTTYAVRIDDYRSR